MSRLAVAAAAGVATGALVLGGAAPASAGPVPAGAAASSVAVTVVPGGGVTATLTTDGPVGALLAPLVNPVLNTVSTTLLAALTGSGSQPSLPARLVSALTNLTGLSAGTPSTQVANPAPTFPNCADPAWSNGTCYALSSQASTTSPLVQLSIPTARGYTDADPSSANDQPLIGRAQVGDPTLTLLGQGIGDLGLVDATSTCPASSAGRNSTGLANASLLGSQVTASVAQPGGTLMVSVAGASAVAVDQLATTTITLANGLPVTLAPAGNNGLGITIRLDLAALLGGLGLSAISGLTDANSGSINLSVVLAPGGSTATSTTAQAAGLEVKVGLSGTLGVSVAGVLGASLAVAPASGSATGDLLDLQLAATGCGNGTPAGQPPWIPPGLI